MEGNELFELSKETYPTTEGGRSPLNSSSYICSAFSMSPSSAFVRIGFSYFLVIMMFFSSMLRALFLDMPTLASLEHSFWNNSLHEKGIGANK